jgi:hypothetical protein
MPASRATSAAAFNIFAREEGRLGAIETTPVDIDFTDQTVQLGAPTRKRP